MKLARQAAGTWQYVLTQTETRLLVKLLEGFPHTENDLAEISRTDRDLKSAEREKLLNEFLAEYRKELKQQATNLLVKQFAQQEKSLRLTLKTEEREILLQILNDIRVGCWNALGKPESLEMQKSGSSPLELTRYNLMNLAGFFEHHLISLE